MMNGRRKLPKGLFYRRRKDGTFSEIIWCWYYVPGLRQPVKESTLTTDVEEARRYRASRMAEHPLARQRRKLIEQVTVDALLDLFEEDYRDHGRAIPSFLVKGLRHKLGHIRASELTRAQLDQLVRGWRTSGISYPERSSVGRSVRAVDGATCNRGMAVLRRARNLGMDKLGITLPRLTFPRFRETPKGRYIPAEVFYAILVHLGDAVKCCLFELAYLTGVRKGQLRMTELRNVRVDVDGRVTALVWEAEKVKARRPHEVPLVGRAQEIVQDLWDHRRLDCRWLFQIDGRPIGQLTSELRRACRRAGVPYGRRDGFVFHHTRHSCLTNLAAEGVPDSVARSISGHRTASVHARYQITQDAAKRAALEAVNSRLAARARP